MELIFLHKRLLAACLLCVALLLAGCKNPNTPSGTKESSSGTPETSAETTVETDRNTEKETETALETDPETEPETKPETKPETVPETKPVTDDPIPEESYIKTGQDRTDGSPVASVPAGVYYQEISVKFTCKSGCTVYYTTDCTEPTVNSTQYRSAIRLSGESNQTVNTGVTVRVIRAAAFDSAGKKVGLTVTYSYIFPAERDRFTTDVISLVSEPDNLYGYENGILVPGRLADEYAATHKQPKNNFDARGKEWERPGSFEMFSQNGELAFAQNIGIRVSGNGSRVNTVKSLKIYPRKEYTPDTGKLKYPLIEGLTSSLTGELITEYDSILLRSGASNEGNTIFTSPLVTYLSRNCASLVSANFKPVTVFLNGKYYGFMMLFEDMDDTFFANHYGVNEDFVSTINYTVVHEEDYDYLGAVPDDGDPAQLDEWNKVKNFIESSDMTQKTNYEKAGKYLDLANFSQYIALECYLDSWDWPRNNTRIWRYYENGYQPDAEAGFDGRWRFILKDMDIALAVCVNRELGYMSHVYTDFFQVLNKDGNVFQTRGMFWSLMENSSFRKMFYEDLCELMSLSYSTDELMRLMSEMETAYAKEINTYLAYYGQETYAEWDAAIERMRIFAEQRASYVIEDIRDSAQKNLIKVTVKAAEGGSITIGRTRLTLDEDRVIYVVKGSEMDYNAEPDAGYTFSGIKSSSSSAVIRPGDQTLSIYNTGVVLTPSFRKTGTVPAEPTPAKWVCINEVGYSGSHAVNGADWIELYNPTDSEISLKGMKMEQGSTVMTLPDIRIPAKGFTVLICDGTGTGRHMNFKISFGETITLRDADGNKLDQVKIDCKSSQVHLGRYPDGGVLISMSNAELTPGCANIHYEYNPIACSDAVKNKYLLNGKLFDPETQLKNGKINRSELLNVMGGGDAAKNYIWGLGNSVSVDWATFVSKFTGRKYYVEAAGTYIMYLQ